MNLLEAYEELTRKESLCLKEERWEDLLLVQSKKGKLTAGLHAAQDNLHESERIEFRERMDYLKAEATANANLLAAKMKENRDLFKTISRNSKSGTKAIKAYGQPEGAQKTSSSRIDRA